MKKSHVKWKTYQRIILHSNMANNTTSCYCIWECRQLNRLEIETVCMGCGVWTLCSTFITNFCIVVGLSGILFDIKFIRIINVEQSLCGNPLCQVVVAYTHPGQYIVSTLYTVLIVFGSVLISLSISVIHCSNLVEKENKVLTCLIILYIVRRVFSK